VRHVDARAAVLALREQGGVGKHRDAHAAHLNLLDGVHALVVEHHVAVERDAVALEQRVEVVLVARRARARVRAGVVLTPDANTATEPPRIRYPLMRRSSRSSMRREGLMMTRPLMSAGMSSSPPLRSTVRVVYPRCASWRMRERYGSASRPTTRRGR
jgi:hypothetical protein